MSKLSYIALGILAGCVCTLIVLTIEVATFFTTKPDLSPETFGVIGLVIWTFMNIIAFLPVLFLGNIPQGPLLAGSPGQAPPYLFGLATWNDPNRDCPQGGYREAPSAGPAL